MNILKVNGYRLYGESSLNLVPSHDAILDIEKRYSLPSSAPLIELTVTNCRFNRGTQEGKDLSNLFIDVIFIDYNGDKYEGTFLIGWLKEAKGRVSFSAQCSGAITLTKGDQ